eukprot:57817-Chlamydomonas_euryale.AAC.1
MHGRGRDRPAADMHGCREGRAMQRSSSKDQLQQCMAAAERGQLLAYMPTVERGSLAKSGTSEHNCRHFWQTQGQSCNHDQGLIAGMCVPVQCFP